MRSLHHALVLTAAFAAAACTQSSVSPSTPSGPASGTELAPQGLRLSATVNFGIPHTGSGFPPNSHDQSFRAPDSLVPQTVVIDAGGTVTFKSSFVHQVAIYEPGIQPADIDTGALAPPVPGCPPVPLIDDADGRIAVLDAQPCAGGDATLQYTFTEPGRYLVICTVLPHFAVARMYGWVVVRDR
ncbi:MAG TPA: plastocyanin/azurin family copper-binding protein [Vicinamibacterales bacterium]|nr:plastocyanin/azurin family copper-binding protein [Vicinamibacterales bacterium]